MESENSTMWKVDSPMDSLTKEELREIKEGRIRFQTLKKYLFKQMEYNLFFALVRRMDRDQLYQEAESLKVVMESLVNLPALAEQKLKKLNIEDPKKEIPV